MKLIGPEDRKCVSTPRARNDRGRLVSGALGFAWVAGEKKNKVWEHRKCSTIHTRVVRRDGLLCVVVYCHRCEAWYFMPEMVVALVREASDPSIFFFFGERWVREWNSGMEGGKSGCRTAAYGLRYVMWLWCRFRLLSHVCRAWSTQVPVQVKNLTSPNYRGN